MFFPFIGQIPLKKEEKEKVLLIGGFVNFSYQSQADVLLIRAFCDILTESTAAK